MHGLACHVTDSRHPPEVACVIAAKIPGVENVTFLTALGVVRTFRVDWVGQERPGSSSGIL